MLELDDALLEARQNGLMLEDLRAELQDANDAAAKLKAQLKAARAERDAYKKLIQDARNSMAGLFFRTNTLMTDSSADLAELKAAIKREATTQEELKKLGALQTLLSNALKVMHDTNAAIIQNLRP